MRTKLSQNRKKFERNERGKNNSLRRQNFFVLKFFHTRRGRHAVRYDDVVYVVRLYPIPGAVVARDGLHLK